jgi:DNA-binding CsgD family transcriptional regulator
MQMRNGRPVAPLVLTPEEREMLQQWARRPKTAQALAERARIVLACAANKTNSEVADAYGVRRQMVGKWRSRFVTRRCEGLLDEPRPGAPRKISDADMARVITGSAATSPSSR